jgi:hypothetical protein
MDIRINQRIAFVLLMASIAEIATSTSFAQVPMVWSWTASQPEAGFHTGDEVSMRLLDALEQRQDIDFRDVKFREVFRHLSDIYEVPIRLDESAMDEETVHGEELITISLQSIRLKDALNTILSPLNLTYTLRAESLLVTNRRSHSEIHVLYDVNSITIERNSEGASPRLTPDSLGFLIESSIAVDQWSNAGGTSLIHPFFDAHGGRKLLVVANLDTQEMIQALLRRLANSKSVQSAWAKAILEPTNVRRSRLRDGRDR